MSLRVHTSVQSLAFRRDTQDASLEVKALLAALQGDQQIVSPGLLLQELLQCFSGARAQEQLIERFAALPFISPDRQDHVEAAQLRNHCRQRGAQLGTIDALLAQLCIRHDLMLLSVDQDFAHAAKHCALRHWRGP